MSYETLRKHSWVLLLAAFGLAACSNSNSPKKAEEAPPAQPVYFKVDPATAGVLSGKISFSGKRPPHTKVDMDEDPQCQSLHPTPVYDDPVAVNHNGTLANVFVYVKEGLGDKKFQPPAAPAVMDQRGCWFVPRVLGMETGQMLKVTNSDPVTHNIHPRAQINLEWNHSQASGAPPIEKTFTKQEVMIRVKCNIHSWMHAWIGVVDNPYFAVTGSDGTFTFKNLPPGTYTIEAWQEKLGTQDKQITVAPSSNAVVNFQYKGE